eukprot:CAMPEP_0170536980 /NCGR_PEP_ID=MMETSP0209-20121228/102455_1 /TAXON_ID=665100 ORGANISM="Litonotus pictus, Strain P1" /NCGR_SAMPLE_ID=MMETSP0209 /ASSEMBLY_ACC=CAM_ASM_000301 /LENGTH=693 /DNA_ID=CAMNT_0010838415 /DNA_START=67 /DNA_END=2147 /DNA_ORIENTATION=-
MKLFYGTGPNQLSMNGFKQHLLLGKLLMKKKYKELITDESTKVNVLSSPKERCIFSATGQVLGMFPGKDIEYKSQNPALNIKEDDVPPGYEDFFLRKAKDAGDMESANDSDFKKDANNVADDESKIDTAVPEDKDVRDKTDESKEVVNGALNRLSLNIVDPGSDGMFHPDTCYFVSDSDSKAAKSTDVTNSSEKKEENAESNSNPSSASTDKTTTSVSSDKDYTSSRIESKSNLKKQNPQEKNKSQVVSFLQLKGSPKKQSIIKNTLKFTELSSFVSFLQLKGSPKKQSIIKNTLKFTELYKLTDKEIHSAIDVILKALKKTFHGKISDKDWNFPFIGTTPKTKYTEKTLTKLVGFLDPLRYHFTGDTREGLFFTSELESTIKKVTINHFYNKKLTISKEHRLLFSGIMGDILSKLDNLKKQNPQEKNKSQVVSFLQLKESPKKPSIIKNTLKFTELYKLTDKEIHSAIDTILKALKKTFHGQISDKDWNFPFIGTTPKTKYTEKTLTKLVGFLDPLRYHFTGDTREGLFFTSELESTIKKVTINHFYNKKLTISKEHRLLFSGIMGDILSKLDSEEKSLNLYSGHDTNLVNFLTNILDIEKIKPKLLQAALPGGNNKALYSFFIPRFASNLILELNKDEDDKYVKVIYNNKEITEDWVTGINYIEGKGIKLEEFKTVFSSLVENTSNGKWMC